MSPTLLPTSARRHARRVFAPVVGALVLLGSMGVTACQEGGTVDPGTTRFGQVGFVRLVMETPLALGEGQLRQELEWSSDGTWTLRETVLYDGVAGDSNLTRLSSNMELSAGKYATWIVQVNDTPGLDLFDTEALDPYLDPDCADLQSRVTLTIRDDVRNQESSWTRCAQGPLRDLTPVGAGPDPAASRVAIAGTLARASTVGDKFASVYLGTVPFATIDRGEDSGAALTTPLVIQDQADWTSFWSEHSRSQGPAPQVDFERDLVLVGAVGQREEAGDSVEIRRVRAVSDGTVVELHELVPGDFCSPAQKIHIPFHIVRVPRVPLPIRYAEVQVDLVPCG